MRIGVPLDAPPFGSQDANRNPVGFDIEVAEMVAKALGVKVELQQITGANRIPFLLTDKVDIVISVMGLTPERAKQITFSAPYANTFLAVYGAKSLKVTSAADVGSNKIAAAKGTTQDLAISEMNPKAALMRTEDDATAATAYLSGQAELFATNSIVAQALAETEPQQGVRPQIRNPSQPRPHGRPHGRVEPRALAGWVHLLQYHERRAGPAAPQVSRHADGPAADTLRSEAFRRERSDADENG